MIAIVVWLPFREKHNLQVDGLLWTAILAISIFVSVLTFNYAVKLIDVSVGTTIRSLGFVVTIFLTVLISQEGLTTKDWWAIVIVFTVIAVVLFGTKSL